MEHIWAPWRIGYIRRVEKRRDEGCILCEKPKEDKDAENYIVYRGKKNFIILNSYPYNPGHLMIAPYRHVASLDKMNKEELHEHIEIISRGLTVLREVFSPGGFNIGVNMGKIAGAGIDGHAHTHIVPRWQGDTNFMPVIGDTRVIPEALADTYERLRGKF